MYNHFMMFADEGAAIAALSDYGSQSPDGWRWDTSRVISGQRVILARVVYDWTDPDNPTVTSPEQSIPGYFITVTLPEINPSLRDLPDTACRLIGDAATGNLVYTAPDLDPGLLSTAIIEPVPAGSGYKFGG